MKQAESYNLYILWCRDIRVLLAYSSLEHGMIPQTDFERRLVRFFHDLLRLCMKQDFGGGTNCWDGPDCEIKSSWDKDYKMATDSCLWGSLNPSITPNYE